MGIANNNPGNIRASSIEWEGQVASVDGFCVFDTAEHGLRALAVQLLNEQRIHGRHTIGDIIPAYAPAADHNDVAAYVADVCQRTGSAAGQQLDLQHAPDLFRLTKAIIAHENGECPYLNGEILAAVNAALGISPKESRMPNEPESSAKVPFVQRVPSAVAAVSAAAAGTAGAGGVVQYCATWWHMPPMPDQTAAYVGAGVILLAHILYKRFLAK